MKKKINLRRSDLIDRVRLRDCWDFLFDHRNQLTPDQIETIRHLKALIKDGFVLSKKQVEQLYEIRRSLEPTKELIIRENK